jgi:PAS domain S-box-containing protein
VYPPINEGEADMATTRFSHYLRERLCENDEFILYRARPAGRENEEKALILVATRPSRESAGKLEHEFSLRMDLYPDWAVRPVALVEEDGWPMLVLDDPGGEPLDQLIHGPMELGPFLRLAVSAAGALRELHTRHLIHKNLKPANLLVDAGTGQVRLMGFGVASRLQRERQAPAPPETIAGSLPYMAPEQTGRMNRSVDARSDLYALGVMLYQMLTGCLPFTAADPLEWVHCHIARRPVPPAERLENVPVPVSAIVMKLLAKTAEERYQTAAGLEHDLRRCLAQWEAEGRIGDFPLGEHDTPDRLLIPEKLYGRSREIEGLLAAFDRIVKGGAPELVLVSGYSGIGKSSVVNELHKVLVPPRGLFASGKFDQYKRDIPYATLSHAFQSLIHPLLGKSEAELARWRDALQVALGPNGQLIEDLAPALGLIIGEQPPVPELPLQDAQRRFHLVFRRFLGVFARPEHPLALFLDDLQWLDAATFDLIEDLVTHPDVHHFLLIGAYRDNEVTPAHPLMHKLEAIRKAGALVQEIVLAPLTREDVGRLIADSLYCDRERAAPLAQLVHEKTAGNPFFTIQFLSALADEGLLRFQHDAGHWSWDLERIHAKGYTDNVVNFMVGKLSRLPIGAQKALRQLACLGNSADSALLAMVCEDSKEALHSDLEEALRTGLVLHSEGAYEFLHDRVQEAAYSLIPESSRAEVHLRIGRLLTAHTPPDKQEEAIFDIVNQLNRGVALLTSRDEREHLAELNLMAGKRAKASTAYVSALTYLGAGRALLSDESWDHHYELVCGLEFHLAECEFLTGNMTAAEDRLSRLAQRARLAEHITAVVRLRITLYTALDRSDRAIEVCLQYLERSGTHWSPRPTSQEVQREYDRIWSQIGNRSIEALVDLPTMTDPNALGALDVLAEVAPAALYTDENLISLVICRMVNVALEYGNSGGSCFAYVALGMIAGPRFHDYQLGFRFGRLGYDLVEKSGWQRFQPRIYMLFGCFVMPWTTHLRASRDLLRRAFDAANRIGDVTYAASSCAHLGENLLAAGAPLAEAQREAQHGLEFAQKARFGFVSRIMTAQLGLIRTLRGLSPKFGSFDGTLFDELPFERQLSGDPSLAQSECLYWILKLQARFFAGDYPAAIHASANAQRLLWIIPASIQEAEFHFYSALSHAACCDATAGDERRQHFEALAEHHRRLEIWAANCPENFGSRAALVRAEIARLEDRALDAMDLYEQAIRSAQANGFVQNEALAYELAARFYAARGSEQIADMYLRNARSRYVRWGADGKVSQLDRLYPHLRENETVPGPINTIGAPVEHLDLATVVKVSQAVSGEIVLEKLVETLLRTAIQQASAERGLLILAHRGELSIRAEANTSGTSVMVSLRETPVSAAELPESVIRYVARTYETVIIDDASAQNPFSADDYFRAKRPRSVLCLPLVKQHALIALLYLENNLAPRIFTSARLKVLNVLASQAAMSLENSLLYHDLAESESYLAEAQRLSHTGSFGWVVPTGEILWSEETFRIFEYDPATRPTIDLVIQRVHPEDRALVRKVIDGAAQDGSDFDIEHRLLMPDKRIKYLHVIAHRRSDESGKVEFIGAVRDVTAAKIAEQKIKQDEAELRQLINVVPEHVLVMEADGARPYGNQAMRDYFGTSLEGIQAKDFYTKSVHPEDVASGVLEERERAVARGVPWEGELRLRRKDGEYRWFLIRCNPLRNEDGKIIRRYATATDIDDRKRTEERVRKENIALREEVGQASMFDEIIGTSSAIKVVLHAVEHVAGTDATVLIQGETGTGKELIARAIHNISLRYNRPLVKVNCAALPASLIESELFGHEKGAFTGALRSKVGRFELANGGTIFLDEIGELPIEMQVKLLRVIQSSEFERLGGTQTLSTDVRIISATNRDLEKAVAEKTFREDLFYRLNVFPIHVPPLCERREDIPLLVDYFVRKYAKKIGREIKVIPRSVLSTLENYNWPGNIRELENIIERSIILCHGHQLEIGNWFRGESQPEDEKRRRTLTEVERAHILQVLDSTHWRVSGPNGAAQILGINPQTLVSRMKKLGIHRPL